MKFQKRHQPSTTTTSSTTSSAGLLTPKESTSPKKEVSKDFKRKPGFDPITFTVSENSNYGRESLLEV